MWRAGQCEFSFAKTQSVLEMNRQEMQRFELIYKYDCVYRVILKGMTSLWCKLLYIGRLRRV